MTDCIHFYRLKRIVTHFTRACNFEGSIQKSEECKTKPAQERIINLKSNIQTQNCFFLLGPDQSIIFFPVTAAAAMETNIR